MADEPEIGGGGATAPETAPESTSDPAPTSTPANSPAKPEAGGLSRPAAIAFGILLLLVATAAAIGGVKLLASARRRA